jgi:mRNA-degrading endonuclease YafQ of YafQ-DinJ toxin-antitoxin module
MTPVAFRTSDLYRSTLVDKARAYPIIGQKMQEFRKFKSENPLQQFGSSDKPFQGGGHFGRTISGLKHAHLTHDIMVVYSISGRNPTLIDLYGIFSHDELGIGQPANIKRQKSQAQRLSGQQFS